MRSTQAMTLISIAAIVPLIVILISIGGDAPLLNSPGPDPCSDAAVQLASSEALIGKSPTQQLTSEPTTGAPVREAVVTPPVTEAEFKRKDEGCDLDKLSAAKVSIDLQFREATQPEPSVDSNREKQYPSAQETACTSPAGIRLMRSPPT
ncbi:MAG: hypothetical protein ACI841_002538 [Planctomycetota bacterium]|jgi:hypothetical protein